MRSRNIQDPESRIQDQSIFATIFIATAKFGYHFLCNYRVDYPLRGLVEAGTYESQVWETSEQLSAEPDDDEPSDHKPPSQNRGEDLQVGQIKLQDVYSHLLIISIYYLFHAKPRPQHVDILSILSQ